MSGTKKITLAESVERSKTEPLRRRIKEQSAEIKELRGDNDALLKRLDVLESIDSIVVEPPAWVSRKPAGKGKLHRGIPTLMLSDCHWDEVVNPDEVEGANCYNRKIAIKRLQRVVEGTIEMTRRYLSGLDYEGFTLLLGGDMLSGNIHEELEQTNEDTVIGSVDFWVDHLVGVISALADEFGRVAVVGVVGNHGRNTRKPRAKLRVRDNFDWMLYRIAARFFANDDRVTFQIPESADCPFKIYDTAYRLSHGDQFRGGSGIAGMLSPLMLGRHRKVQRQMSLKRPFEWLVMGHWHDYWIGKGLIVNGSIKGMDEYSYTSNFDFQRPQQALFVTTPENGLTVPVAIYADDRKAEGW